MIEVEKNPRKVGYPHFLRSPPCLDKKYPQDNHQIVNRLVEDVKTDIKQQVVHSWKHAKDTNEINNRMNFINRHDIVCFVFL